MCTMSGNSLEIKFQNDRHAIMFIHLYMYMYAGVTSADCDTNLGAPSCLCEMLTLAQYINMAGTKLHLCYRDLSLNLSSSCYRLRCSGSIYMYCILQTPNLCASLQCVQEDRGISTMCSCNHESQCLYVGLW